MEGPATLFEEFGLSEPVLRAVREFGYEVPTPIQQKTIPLLLAGRDVIGQAQTGTGKTAAFALPILDKLDVSRREVQALVLTPTRELGIQVAEAFYVYSKYLGERPGAVRVLPVYGGQALQAQFARLKSGVHVVVGTPGRIMDHLRRGTLNFDALKVVILDEADEMLRMGFIEDVEWILAQAPGELQKALFSATIPKEIRAIADRYLTDPVAVSIENKTLTVPSVEQRFVVVNEQMKLDTLAQVLELETDPGVATLVFARTKLATAELTDKLQARGIAADAMHGDMSQALRENVIRRLRAGDLEVVVATDVAARGLDVERIGMVVNYDVPYDSESYVHRIGRTGRAGRAGKALLFITPRQKRLLNDIERFTGQKIEPAKLPTQADVAARRIALFKERILEALEDEDIELYLNLVEELVEESGRDVSEIAAAAARLARGDRPLEAVAEAAPEIEAPRRDDSHMVRLMMDVGKMSGLRPADIVGAIANEADIPGRVIGAIDIHDRFSFVDVPANLLEPILRAMDNVSIRNRKANLRVVPTHDRPPVAEHGRFRGHPKRAFNKKGKKRRD